MLAPTMLLALLLLLLLLALSAPDRTHAVAAANLSSHANANVNANGIVVAANLTYDQLGGQPYTVDYDYRSLRINGQRVFLQSGSVHYPRMTPDEWPAVLKTLRAAGLNTLQTYVFWNYHETEKGVWDFTTESRNLGAFLQAAADAGLFVNLRIGPYVCAEWFEGGIPLWLHGLGFEFRQYNDGWTTAMAYFVHQILAYVEPYLARNGGPIILAQIENEYGERGPAGNLYVEWCANLTQQVAVDVPWVMCKQPDAPQPVIFACNGWECDTQVVYQQVQRQQPAVWTENWTGWFSSFGGSLPARPVENIAYAVALFAARGGSFHNYYMWYGGTNFANYGGGPGYTTSYDYNAPVDEYGLPRNPKFSHLAALHRTLTTYATAMLSQNLSSPVSQGSYSSSFTYGTLGQPGSVVFLANPNTTNADKFTFAQRTFSLTPYSVQIVDGVSLAVVFDSSVASAALSTEASVALQLEQAAATADAADSTAGAAAGVPSATPSMIAQFPEPINMWSNNAVVSDVPLDQIQTTQYLTPYMLYQTSVALTSQQIASGSVVLTLMQAGDTEHVYLDDVKLLTTRGATNSSFTLNVADFAPGAHDLKIMNVLQGLNNDPKGWRVDGITGPVLWDGVNITAQQWLEQVGTYGEFVQIYEPSSVVVRWNTSYETNVPMTWYNLQITTPQPSGPVAEANWQLDLSGMGRGFTWVNGFGIGPYANDIATDPPCDTCTYVGPWADTRCRYGCKSVSQTLYKVPRSILAPVGTANMVVLIEETGGAPSTVALVQRVSAVDAQVDPAVAVVA